MKFIKTLALAALVALSAACTQIDTGHVGVESTFGQVKEEALPPGVYMTAFKTVHEISAKEVPLELNDLTPKTKDRITMKDLDITVYYRVNPSHAAKLMVRYAGDLTRDPGMEASIVGSGVVKRIGREAAYKATAKFDSSDIHLKRTELAADIRSALSAEIAADAGKGAFEVTNVIVRSLLTDPALEQSIRDAAAVENQIRQKQGQIDLAKAEAERKRVEAEGEAKANTIIANSLTPTLIELRRIEAMAAFAGKGTSTVLLPSGGATPLIQVK